MKVPNGNGTPYVPEIDEGDWNTLIDDLEHGVPIRAALMAAGISKSVFYRIKEAAEAATTGKLKEWWDNLVWARARGERYLWRKAEQGGKGSATALTVLERSYGYSRREAVEQTVEHKGGVVLNIVPGRDRHRLAEDADDSGSEEAE